MASADLQTEPGNRPTTSESSRIDWVCCGLVLLGLAARIAGLPFESHDADWALIPWYTSLSQSGFSVLGTDAYNYNPPYIYLLWLSSLAFGPHHPLLAIKCIGIVGDIGLCVAVALLLARTTSSPVSFARAFAIMWCVPTVVVNSSVWGQCDAIYAAFVVGTLAAVSPPPRSILALALFGIAVGFKMQALLAAPVGVLLLFAGRIRWSAILACVVCYVALLVPAAMAGRPWAELLTVYLRQSNTYPWLSMSAPNVWTVLKHFIPAEGNSLWIAICLLPLLAATVAYLIIGTRRLSEQTSTAILEVALVSVFVFPFLLPKMHERYFFLADVLSVALALVDRRWISVALLIQLGSLSAYAPFLLGWTWPVAVGVASNTLVFAALVLRWYPSAGPLIPAKLLRYLERIVPAAEAPSG